MSVSEKQVEKWIREISTKNSQSALGDIFVFYYSKIYSFVFSYVQSEAIAEEIVSDVFMVVWDKRGQLSEIQYFRTYLYTIARNLAISHIRKESNRITNTYSDEIIDTHVTHFTPETDLISSEMAERLDVAINSLPEKCRQTYLLVREQNLKYKEIAEILNISIKTLEAHMSLAIRRLREALSGEWDQ